MAFLDNSGDIILDAVLTDTGRLRMAQGDGSFKITKFALGDDEINYALFNKDHASGSAYYDLEVLQTPVLEAFTNNTSNLKTKLVTMSRTNVLYMPVLKVNPNNAQIPNEASKQPLNSNYFRRTDVNAGGWLAGLAEAAGSADTPFQTRYYIAADSTTFDGVYNYRKVDSTTHTAQTSAGSAETLGVVQGYTALTQAGALIRVDQGLDTVEISVGQGMDTDLKETAYIVELDYRLGRIKRKNNNSIAPVNFIDDDNIATYYLSGEKWVDFTPEATNGLSLGSEGEQGTLLGLPTWNPQVFGNGKGTGPRGSSLKFRIQASQELQQSTYLFSQLGAFDDLTTAAGNDNIAGLPNTSNDGFLNLLTEKKLYYIDSTVRIVGANTGYRLDVPIRFIKLA